jgi:hypothetical protein
MARNKSASAAAAADIAAGEQAAQTAAEAPVIDSNTTNPHAEQPNDTRLADGVKFIRELGKDAALGKDSLPKLAFQITKMSAEGVIDLEKKWESPEVNAKGGKIMMDDAEYLFNEYSKAEGKRAIHERTLGGQKANVSKLRQFVAFGALTTCDAQSVLERSAAIRKQMIVDSKKVKSAYAAYVDVAREQQKHDADLTDDQLEGVITKPEKASPELRKLLDSMYKKLEKLYTDGIEGVQDQSDHIKTAADAIRDRLSEIDAINAPDQTDEEVQTELMQMATKNSDQFAAILASLGYQKAN